MSKRIYIIIITLLLLAIVGGGYAIYQHQQNKYTNFKDPKLTNDELSQVDGKIKELESEIKNKQNSATNDDLFKLQFELATQYHLRGRLLDAYNELHEAAKTLPDNITPWRELVQVDIDRGDYSGADQDIQKAFSFSKSDNQLWLTYIALKRDHLNASEAEQRDLFKQALDNTNSNVNIVTAYAQFLEQHNDLPGAVQEWKIAEQLNPTGKAQYEAEIVRIQEKLK